MQIDKPLILRLENLAKLDLSEAERSALTDDLNRILKMVDKLQELDTKNVEPLRHITDVVNRLRPDLVGTHLASEEALSNASQKAGPYFSVPKVIEK